MLKYEDFLSESLAAEVKSEPKTAASKEAKKLGLKYMGFGRYADKKGRLAYVVHDDRLVPYKSSYDIEDMYRKVKFANLNDSSAPTSKKPVAKKNLAANQKPDKVTQLNKEFDFHNKVFMNRQKQDDAILNQKNKDVDQLSKEISKFYKPNMFSNEEIDAIEEYTGEMFGPINRFLYKGHDDDTDPSDIEIIENYIEQLDSAFEDTQAPFAYTTYTGLSDRYRPEKIKVGGEYIFRGFVSTSISFNTAIQGFTESGNNDTPVVLQVEISKGQKSIYVDSLSQYKGEKETLLPRGSKIKVISGPHLMDDSLFVEDPQGIQIHLFHCQLVEDL